MDSGAWVQVASSFIIITMLGYNLAIARKLIEQLIEKTDLSDKRIDFHDRAVSETRKISFNTKAIARGERDFPIFSKSHRES